MKLLRAHVEFTRSASPAAAGADEGELTLAPLDPLVVENRRRATLAELPPPPASPTPPEPLRLQVTTRGMLVFMTAASVALAVLRLLPAGAVAGVIAAAALLAMPVFHTLPAIMKKVWWTVFGLYMLACLFAIVQH